MYFPSREEVEYRRKRYPAGTRVICTMMNDPFSPIAYGTRGTVVGVDGIGDLMMEWDNGSTLKLIPGVDGFRVVTEDDKNSAI